MIYTGKLHRAEVYHNTRGETPEVIKARTGCTTIVNGMLFNPDGSFCLKARINGKTLANENGTFYGYGWSGNAPPVIAHSDSMGNYDNYITSIHIAPTIKRGRTAISFYDGKYTVLCVADGTQAMTIPQVEETMRKYNGQFLILDGGGSSYLDCPSGKVDATYSRKTANRMYILIWEDGEQKKGGDTLKVCLDPGHGGNDISNGSPDGTYKEHEFNLDLAKRIKSLLEKHGIEVKMTREINKAVDLATRPIIANNAKVDLFVSLHSNASGSGWSNASGLCVYTYASGASSKRNIAAQLLIDQMEAAGVKLFGSKLYHSNFTVLANTDMPAYLVEYGFHTNKSDVALLKSTAHRDKLAQSTAKAICDYFGVAWIEDKPTQPESGKIYRVQIGAFINRAYAEALEARLKAEGYSTMMVEG